MTYEPTLMVKQYVATVASRWCRWRVFKTGREGWYLFVQIDPRGCDTGLSVPVQAKRLRDDIRRGLANGWGNT